jgi:hypothetical protein
MDIVKEVKKSTVVEKHEELKENGVWEFPTERLDEHIVVKLPKLKSQKTSRTKTTHKMGAIC